MSQKEGWMCTCGTPLDECDAYEACDHTHEVASPAPRNRQDECRPRRSPQRGD